MAVFSQLLDQLAQYDNQTCLIENDQSLSYSQLLKDAQSWASLFVKEGIQPGTVISLEGDLSSTYLEAFIGAIQLGCIVLPIGDSVLSDKRQDFLKASQVEVRCQISQAAEPKCAVTDVRADHELLQWLRNQKAAGLILCTSGTSGKPKAVLHSAERFFSKFLKSRKSFRTLAFFAFDHMAGMDAVWYGLASGSTLVLAPERSPEGIAQAVQKHKVEVLPTSPTFLNLFLLSGVLQQFDLSSLKIITYGSEPMPEPLLKKLNASVPDVKLIQKFGMSELGSPPSKSKGPESLWIKIASESLKIKAVEGILWIHSPHTMLGYLNAKSPIDAEGWLNTGDRVEVDGEYVRFLGRDSDLINVGGEKVDPLEIESVIAQADNIQSVIVKAERHALMGNIVVADICLEQPEDAMQLRHRLQWYCRERLASYQIPVKFTVVERLKMTDRFKQERS